MDCQILYCGPCGYLERAESLARELRSRFDARVRIEEGKLGQFDVRIDGERVASKGGFLRRVLVHGAPAEEKLLEAIELHVGVRSGDACTLPEAGDDHPAGPVRRSDPGGPRGA